MIYHQGSYADSLKLVKNISYNTKIQHPSIQTDNGTIYFFVEGSGGSVDGLYKTDGTEAGTELIKQLNGEWVKNIVVLGNKLIFSYGNSNSPPNGVELWVSDGTTAGTHLIEDLNPGNGDGVEPLSDNNSHFSMMAFNNYVYFGGTSGTANGGTNPSNLYRTDGNTIELVKQTALSHGINAAPHHFVIFNDRLFFTADTDPFISSYYRSIWSTDGSAQGTNITIKLSPTIDSNGYTLNDTARQPYFKVFKDMLCFQGKAWTGFPNKREAEFYCAKYDSNQGLYITTKFDINPLIGNNVNMGSNPQLALVTDSHLYFVANDGTHGGELWAFTGEDSDNDGSIDPPYMLKDINVGAGTSMYGFDQFVVEDEISEVNGIVVFAAISNPNGGLPQLWKTDGTPAGTTLLKDFSPNYVQVGGSNGETVLNTFKAFKDAVYFTSGNKLWRTDGTTARMVTDAFVEPKQFSVHGDSLYMMGSPQNFGAYYPLGNVGSNLFKLEPVPTKTLVHNQWTQISLPCDAVDKRKVSDIFADDIPAPNNVYGVDWELFKYDTSLATYTALGISDDLSQNEAYWIIQLTGGDITVDMPAMCNETPVVAPNLEPECNNPRGCYKLPLTTRANQIGWNLIGNVFEKPITLASSIIDTNTGNCASGCSLPNADTYNIFHQNIFVYNGTSYDILSPFDEIPVWQGAWAATLEYADGLSPELLMDDIP